LIGVKRRPTSWSPLIKSANATATPPLGKAVIAESFVALTGRPGSLQGPFF